jgi:DNA adenine methylase
MCSVVIGSREWLFRAADFRETLREVAPADFLYADPPYAGRHVDYYNSWSDMDEAVLSASLKELPCKFILSTWYKNKYRSNPSVAANWQDPRFCLQTRDHFYHVGSSEDLRHAMTEALITNFKAQPLEPLKAPLVQPGLFDQFSES